MLHLDKKDGNSKEEIIFFKDTTLKKCQEVWAIRKGFTNSKYASIVLPVTINSTEGYHARCYKNFIAVCSTASKATDKPEDSVDDQAQPSSTQESSTKSTIQLRSTSVLKSESRTGILEAKCILCKKKDRKHKGVKEKLVQCLTKNIEVGIRNDAKTLGDVKLLGDIVDIDFVAKEVRYHQICRVEYANRAKAENSKKGKPPSDHHWHVSREAHALAFTSICSFVDDLIIKSEEVHFFNDVYRHYMSFLEDSCEMDYDSLATVYKPHHLLIKIQQHYGDTLQVLSLPPGRGVGRIIFKSSMSMENAILKTVDKGKSLAVQVSGSFIFKYIGYKMDVSNKKTINHRWGILHFCYGKK